MKLKFNAQTITTWTAVAVTVAVLAKTFIPFYWIGSTAIFAGASALAMLLVLINWRSVRDESGKIPEVIFLLVALYGLVIVNFVFLSRPAVPFTYLLGILIFHGLFLTFGFAAARALETVLLVLLSAGAVYSAILMEYAVRFGDVMRGLGIDDVFGIGTWSVYITFHQNIGLVIGLGALAALGLASNKITKALAISAFPVTGLFLFHIAARTALVALASSLAFLGFAKLWTHSRKVTLLIATVIFVVVTVVLGTLPQLGLNPINADAKALDAFSRTIRELRDSNPGFRLPIWEQTWHDIVSEPGRMLLGHGIGMYPVEAGFGPPDWLLNPTQGTKPYPHSVHLEILYETGIVGFVLFSILIILPIVASMRRWSVFSLAEKSAVTLYVFILVSSEISGAFAYTYMLQFFLALSVGVIALRDTSKVEIPYGQMARR